MVQINEYRYFGMYLLCCMGDFGFRYAGCTSFENRMRNGNPEADNLTDECELDIIFNFVSKLFQKSFLCKNGKTNPEQIARKERQEENEIWDMNIYLWTFEWYSYHIDIDVT